jgi:L-galactose dehydrogenase
MGLLTQAGPPGWHPAPTIMKAACRSAAEACARDGADLAALALRFAVDTPIVATTLVGMGTVAQVDRNLDAAARPLDRPLLERIRAILEPVAGTTWPSGRPENSR